METRKLFGFVGLVFAVAILICMIFYDVEVLTLLLGLSYLAIGVSVFPYYYKEINNKNLSASKMKRVEIEFEIAILLFGIVAILLLTEYFFDLFIFTYIKFVTYILVVICILRWIITYLRER